MTDTVVDLPAVCRRCGHGPDHHDAAGCVGVVADRACGCRGFQGRSWCAAGCDPDGVVWGTVHADLYLAHGLVAPHGPGGQAMLSAFREAQKVRRADNHAHVIHRTGHGPWHTPDGESLDLLAGQMRRAREPGASFAYVYGIPDSAAGPWPHGDLADGGAPVVEPFQPSLLGVDGVS